jgi:hypothetical protein
MLPLTDKQVIQQSTKLMLISFNHRETHGTDVGGGRHHASVLRDMPIMDEDLLPSLFEYKSCAASQRSST